VNNVAMIWIQPDYFAFKFFPATKPACIKNYYKFGNPAAFSIVGSGSVSNICV
jgi:hypothetical protein